MKPELLTIALLLAACTAATNPSAPPPPHNAGKPAPMQDQIELPAFSGYWKAAANSRRLSAPAILDSAKPVFHVRVTARGRWFTGADGKWMAHADTERVRELLESAATLKAGDSVSTLQVVLEIDRHARWLAALELAEMMVMSRAATLYMKTDGGLLDVSLAVEDASESEPTALAQVRRSQDNTLLARLTVGRQAGSEHGGDSMLANLRAEAAAVKAIIGEVTVSLTAQASAQAFFEVVEMLAVMQPKAWRIGMPRDD